MERKIVTFRTPEHKWELLGLQNVPIVPQMESSGDGFDYLLKEKFGLSWEERSDDQKLLEFLVKYPRVAWAFAQGLKIFTLRGIGNATIKKIYIGGHWHLILDEAAASWTEPTGSGKYALFQSIKGASHLSFFCDKDEWQKEYISSCYTDWYSGKYAKLRDFGEAWRSFFKSFPELSVGERLKNSLEELNTSAMYLVSIGATIFDLWHQNSRHFFGVAEGDHVERIRTNSCYNGDWFGAPGYSYNYVPESSLQKLEELRKIIEI